MAAADPNVGWRVFNPSAWATSLAVVFPESRFLRNIKGVKSVEELMNLVVTTRTGSKHRLGDLLKAAEELGVFHRDIVTQETLGRTSAMLEKIKLGKETGWLPAGPWGRKFAENSEMAMRFNAFKHNVMQGMNFEDAAKATRKYFIDYSPASRFEEIIRDVIPFFKFSREAIPTFATEVAKRPRMAQMMKWMYGSQQQDPDEFLPQFLHDQARVKLNPFLDAMGMENDAPVYLAGLGMVYDDLANKMSGDSLARWAEKNILAQLNPMIRYPLEVISNRSFYSGEERDVFRTAPKSLVRIQEDLGIDMGIKTHKTKAGKTYYTMSDDMKGIVNLLWRDAPTGRMFQTVDKILDKDINSGLTALNLLTGAKVYTIDQEKTRRRLLDRILKRLAKDRPDDVRTFVRVYATGSGKTDPKIKKLLQEHGKRAGERKVPEEVLPLALQQTLTHGGVGR
jgi:hypothetical protein